MAPPVSPWWHWVEAKSNSTPSSSNTGLNTLKSGRCPPPWYGSLATITSPGCNSPARNSHAKRTGSVDESMNCGMPTESAARRPSPVRIVALRSFDWLRMRVVAVRDT
jgi:hypothetical protein